LQQISSNYYFSGKHLLCQNLTTSCASWTGKKRSTRILCERNISFWGVKFRKQWIDYNQYNSNRRPQTFKGMGKEVEALEHNKAEIFSE
jgi:hypothetical protein